MPTLVLCWCPELPHRAGETLVVGREPTVFGRGTPTMAMARPGRLDPTEPLSLRALSRRQWRVTREAGGFIIENEGRQPLLVDGQAVARARVEPGQLAAVGEVLLVSCEQWPVSMRGPAPSHAFGAPDEHGIVGESPAAWMLRERLGFFAPRDGHVLVLGESGTGKELAARLLHAGSNRSRGPFVSRNAATLPDGLVDAEFFGNAHNYPNPGMAERPGLVGMADGGTLFLDELGELPHALQTHLLRLLDSGEYQRLGDRRSRHADLRVVAAANRPLEALKADVSARFALRVTLPPLRERRTDVPLLVRHLMRSIGARNPDLAQRFLEAGEPRITVPLMARWIQQPWPTNARELEQRLWEAMTEADDHWLADRGAPMPPAVQPAAPPQLTPASWDLGLDPSELPAAHVQACLDAHNGVQEEVWRALGLPNRFVLRRLIARHGLVVRKVASRGQS